MPEAFRKPRPVRGFLLCALVNRILANLASEVQGCTEVTRNGTQAAFLTPAAKITPQSLPALLRRMRKRHFLRLRRKSLRNRYLRCSAGMLKRINPEGN